ncbi:MAG: hypothetical protein Q4G40_01100 [Brachybacterium sp.]|nr:hypothetical protein [Brachybacterium sp.]
MLVLSIAVYASCALTVVLAIYYVAKDLSADLVLLGGAAVVFLVWLSESLILTMRHLGGVPMTDAVTLYGYLLTGLAMPLGGIWFGVGERSRWGSAAVLLAILTVGVLQMRLPQIWPEGFA